MQAQLIFDGEIWTTAHDHLTNCPANHQLAASRGKSTSLDLNTCTCVAQDATNVFFSCLPLLECSRTPATKGAPTEITFRFTRLCCIRSLVLTTNAKFVEVYGAKQPGGDVGEYIKTWRGTAIPGQVANLHSIEITDTMVAAQLRLKFLSAKKLEGYPSSTLAGEAPYLVVRDIMMTCQGSSTTGTGGRTTNDTGNANITASVSIQQPSVNRDESNEVHQVAPTAAPVSASNTGGSAHFPPSIGSIPMENILSTLHTIILKSVDAGIAPLLQRFTAIEARLTAVETAVQELSNKPSITAQSTEAVISSIPDTTEQVHNQDEGSS